MSYVVDAAGGKSRIMAMNQAKQRRSRENLPIQLARRLIQRVDFLVRRVIEGVDNLIDTVDSQAGVLQAIGSRSDGKRAGVLLAGMPLLL